MDLKPIGTIDNNRLVLGQSRAEGQTAHRGENRRAQNQSANLTAVIGFSHHMPPKTHLLANPSDRSPEKLNLKALNATLALHTAKKTPQGIPGAFSASYLVESIRQVEHRPVLNSATDGDAVNGSGRQSSPAHSRQCRAAKTSACWLLRHDRATTHTTVRIHETADHRVS